MDLKEVLHKVNGKYELNEIERKNTLTSIQEKQKELERLNSEYNCLNENSYKLRSKISEIEKLINEFQD